MLQVYDPNKHANAEELTDPKRDYGTPSAVSDFNGGSGRNGTEPSSETNLVSLRIDGKNITVPTGTSIMRAAAHLDINIPKLCATDSLEAFGSCRLCLVEIAGRKGFPSSCTTLVEEGLVVKTQSEPIAALRRNVMELYISDNPHD